MAKKVTAPKKEATAKPKAKAKELILKKTLHIANVSTFNDDRTHLVDGQAYLPGTIVTSDMVDAYEANRKAIGGKTPIENFCH